MNYLVVNYRLYLELFHCYSLNVAPLQSITVTVPMLVSNEKPRESELAEHISWFPGQEFTTICRQTWSTRSVIYILSTEIVTEVTLGFCCIVLAVGLPLTMWVNLRLSAEQQLWRARRSPTLS